MEVRVGWWDEAQLGPKDELPASVKCPHWDVPLLSSSIKMASQEKDYHGMDRQERESDSGMEEAAEQQNQGPLGGRGGGRSSLRWY